MFTSTSTIAFKTFACDEEAVEGERFLRADYNLSCDTSKHRWYGLYAGIMIMVSGATLRSVRAQKQLSRNGRRSHCFYSLAPLPKRPNKPPLAVHVMCAVSQGTHFGILAVYVCTCHRSPPSPVVAPGSVVGSRGEFSRFRCTPRSTLTSVRTSGLSTSLLSAATYPPDVCTYVTSQVYPVGIPLLYAFILWRNRESLNPRAVTVAATTGSRPDEEAAKSDSTLEEQEQELGLEERLERRAQNPELVPSMFLWKDFGEGPRVVRWVGAQAAAAPEPCRASRLRGWRASRLSCRVVWVVPLNSSFRGPQDMHPVRMYIS